MSVTVAVTLKPSFKDRHGEHVRHDAADFGITGITAVTSALLYRFDGDLSAADIRGIAERLLTDPITEEYHVHEGDPAPSPSARSIHVWLKPGVTDTVADSVLKAIRDLGISRAVTVKTGHRFTFRGAVSPAALRQAAQRLLANPMIQEYSIR